MCFGCPLVIFCLFVIACLFATLYSNSNQRHHRFTDLKPHKSMSRKQKSELTKQKRLIQNITRLGRVFWYVSTYCSKHSQSVKISQLGNWRTSNQEIYKSVMLFWDLNPWKHVSSQERHIKLISVNQLIIIHIRWLKTNHLSFFTKRCSSSWRCSFKFGRFCKICGTGYRCFYWFKSTFRCHYSSSV